MFQRYSNHKKEAGNKNFIALNRVHTHNLVLILTWRHYTVFQKYFLRSSILLLLQLQVGKKV
jgi:hypothetical protein